MQLKDIRGTLITMATARPYKILINLHGENGETIGSSK